MDQAPTKSPPSEWEKVRRVYEWSDMSILAQVVEASEKHQRFVEDHVRAARTDPKVGQELLDRWKSIKSGIPLVTTPTGLKLPRLALPEIDEAGQIARYLYGEGLPGEFP